MTAHGDEKEPTQLPRIVVGIDGSEPSREALRWAVREARLRGAALHVLHVTHFPVGFGLAPYPTIDVGTLAAAADRMAAREVDAVLGEDRDLAVTHQGAVGVTAQELIDAAKGADLLVVGARGHGGFAGLLLGSVSQQCVHHAPCPVVIVRAVT